MSVQGSTKDPMAPVLDPGLPRLWRNQGCLQLGLDPATAIVIDGLSGADETFLSLLDGRHSEDQAIAAAGISAERAETMLGLLRGSGVLRPAGGGDKPGRESGRVEIRGSGELSRRLSALLRESGVGAVGTGRATGGNRPPSCDLAVLAAGAVTPPELRAWARTLTHLEVTIQDGTARIGPLVIPGQTPCLRCAELTRADRDPAWPLLAAQLAGATQQASPTDPGLVTAVAGLTAMHVLRWLDLGPSAEHQIVGGMLQISSRDLRLRRQSLLPHARCGCGAAQWVR